MKTFLKLTIALIIGVVALGFQSCGSDDDEPKSNNELELTVKNLESGSGQYTYHPNANNTYLLTFKDGKVTVLKFEFPNYSNENTYAYNVRDGYIYVMTEDDGLTITYGYGASFAKKKIDGEEKTILTISPGGNNALVAGEYVKLSK